MTSLHGTRININNKKKSKGRGNESVQHFGIKTSQHENYTRHDNEMVILLGKRTHARYGHCPHAQA